MPGFHLLLLDVTHNVWILPHCSRLEYDSCATYQIGLHKSLRQNPQLILRYHITKISHQEKAGFFEFHTYDCVHHLILWLGIPLPHTCVFVYVTIFCPVLYGFWIYICNNYIHIIHILQLQGVSVLCLDVKQRPNLCLYLF